MQSNNVYPIYLTFERRREMSVNSMEIGVRKKIERQSGQMVFVSGELTKIAGKGSTIRPTLKMVRNNTHTN